jgi:hypothetical protein
MRNNPYAQFRETNRKQLKVNFHTHAGVCMPNKCGELPMDEVIRAYHKAKYDALAISNHNEYIPPPLNNELLVIDAVEYTAHPHMNLVGTSHFHDVPHQQAIDRALEEGAFVILNHPNWINQGYWPIALMQELKGYIGIEILNPVINRLQGSGLAVDTWDALLSSGRPVWGFGNDDFHQWHDLERAYNIISAQSNDFSSIKAAVQDGCFYVSNGLALRSLTLNKNSLEVEAGFFVESYINQFEYTLIGCHGRMLDRSVGKKVILSFCEDEPYIRVEARAKNGSLLFLQPMILDSSSYNLDN